MERPLTASALLLILVVACQCSDRDYPDPEGSSGLTAVQTDSGESTAMDPERTKTPKEPIDVSRFMRTFHYENDFMPFGREVQVIGSPAVANLEIRPDGTAHMSMETCSEYFGTLEISWGWVAHPGPRLEFLPGEGEDSLRFMARTDLESMSATLGEDCELLVEIDGSLLWARTYRPGRACWVNRCENPNYMVHIDYCDGEAPPQCE
jgi:hypothetical protein